MATGWNERGRYFENNEIQTCRLMLAQRRLYNDLVRTVNRL